MGYTSGVFELLQLPTFEALQVWKRLSLARSLAQADQAPFLYCCMQHSQVLSVSKERVTSLAFNHTGDWLAGVTNAYVRMRTLGQQCLPDG